MAKWEFGQGIKFLLLEKAVRKMIERFVSRVISRDDCHEVLRGIWTDGNVICATNGFAMAMARFPNALPDEMQGLKFCELHGPVAMVDPILGHFPELNKVIRRGDEKDMKFAMDPRLLRDILAIFGDCRMVVFRVSDNRSPVEIMGVDEDQGIEAWAWVMPMYAGAGIDKDFVRPEWIKNVKFRTSAEVSDGKGDVTGDVAGSAAGADEGDAGAGAGAEGGGG